LKDAVWMGRRWEQIWYDFRHVVLPLGFGYSNLGTTRIRLSLLLLTLPFLCFLPDL
jgi:hypothetical protein